MGSFPIFHWFAVGAIMTINAWVSRKLYASLMRSRSSRREGVVRLFAVAILALQTFGLLEIAIGTVGGASAVLEMAGVVFSLAPTIYVCGLLVAWIIDGFTGKSKA
jgi:Na+(H+)/acetate symporter ActP